MAVVWTAIGIAITYNQIWNHVLAMCLKPGSPKDLIVSIQAENLSFHLIEQSLTTMFVLFLQKIEKLRKELKNKTHRSSINDDTKA